MIASLNGKILQLEPGSLVLEIGVIGLLVTVPNTV